MGGVLPHKSDVDTCQNILKKHLNGSKILLGYGTISFYPLRISKNKVNKHVLSI